jgi:putative flippase GtrA
MYSDDSRDLRLSALAGQVHASSLFRFLIVGTVGFFTDAAFVYAFVYLLGWHYVVGRLLSFSIAVGVTLLLNRAWTFRVVRDRPVSRSIVLCGCADIGWSVSGLLSPPCRRRAELQDANHPMQIGSHIWSTI